MQQPSTRIWCAFEESTSINDLKLPLDICAFSLGKAVLITEGTVKKDTQLSEEDAPIVKATREKAFPCQALAKGVSLHLEQAKVRTATEFIS